MPGLGLVPADFRLAERPPSPALARLLAQTGKQTAGGFESSI